MSKTRVYELAKEFGMDNKKFIARLKNINITIIGIIEIPSSPICIFNRFRIQ